DGRARATEHHARVVEVEQGRAHAVGVALVVAVIQDQPALFGPDRRSTGPDALAVPQAGTRADDLDVIGPGAHVIAEAEPDGRWPPVERHEPAADALGEQRVVLVVLADD